MEQIAHEGKPLQAHDHITGSYRDLIVTAPLRHKKPTISIGLDCICFNEDTSPSGNISSPAQVDVAYNCFQSVNKVINHTYIVHVRGWLNFEYCIRSGIVLVENSLECQTAHIK